MKETKNKPLTKSELAKATGCPPYLISYYSECGYLPIVKRSSGPGHPNIFHRDAVQIVMQKMPNREEL